MSNLSQALATFIPSLREGHDNNTSYTRAFANRPRNRESWSSDEDDTCAGTPPFITTTPNQKEDVSRQIKRASPSPTQQGESSAALGSNS
ncbi:hypothetical protein TNCV_3574971 [Trichonephila clavipes]|nr:hypothetical protein TNCV_3574971 [Trichonephila clavipes]